MPDPIAAVLTVIRRLLTWSELAHLRERLSLYEDAEGKPRLLFIGGPAETCVRCETLLIDAKIRREGPVVLYLASQHLVYSSGQPQWDMQELRQAEEQALAKYVGVHGAWCPHCRRFVPAVEPFEPCPWL